jgi:integrase
MRELNSLQVRRQDTPGRYRAGANLWLQVTRSKSGEGVVKSWLLRYVVDGKEHWMGLGSLRLFSLQEARARAKRHLQALVDGVDPLEARRQERDARRAEIAGRILFKDAAARFLDLHSPHWKNQKHRSQWRNTLKTYAFPALGDRPVSEIKAAIINETLATIWADKPETASRVKQRIERIVQWVEDGMPLPAPAASKRVQHHPALPFLELPAFMAEIRARDSVSARALEFTVLTAARTSETIGAKWDELDLDAGIWSVPASRMKAGKPHEVPLSKRVIEILKDLPRVGDYVFPGAKDGTPLSNMAMLELLRGMRGNGLTVHGFRSSFRDWAGDRTHFPRDVMEHALAHRIKDKAEASYRRGSALEKRRKLMQEWANFCESPAVKGKVLTMQRKPT